MIRPVARLMPVPPVPPAGGQGLSYRPGPPGGRQPLLPRSHAERGNEKAILACPTPTAAGSFDCARRGPPAMPDPQHEPTVSLPAADPAAAPTAPIASTPADPTEAAGVDVVPADLADHTRYRITRLLGQGGMGAVYLA